MQVQFKPTIKLEIPDEWDALPPALQQELQARMEFALGNLTISCVAPDVWDSWHKDHEIIVTCYLETGIEDEDYNPMVHLPNPAHVFRPSEAYMVTGDWNHDGMTPIAVERTEYGHFGWNI